MRLKNLGTAWKFLIVMIWVYIILFFVNFEVALLSIKFFWGIFRNILLIFILVFIVMFRYILLVMMNFLRLLEKF